MRNYYELLGISINATEQEIKDQLNEYLSFEIESPTNMRKTREILMNIWVYENDYSAKIKATALELIRLYPEYSMPIHWCMMLAAYPVFVDMCKLIGKMSEFQDEITLAQLKQKLFDEWGERTTLFHSTDINSSTYLFPFDYKMEKEALFEDGRFAMNNFGGELSISLND